jgi:hypothetical protein
LIPPTDVAQQPSVLDAPSPSAIRDELERLALLDLLGPRYGPEEELVGQRPHNRYLVGTLAPQRYRVRPEELDAVATAGSPDAEEGADEAEAPSLPTMMPSSIGLSFAVARETRALRLTARWGRYVRMASETLETETGRARRVWKREPIEATSPLIPLGEGAIPKWSPDLKTPDVWVEGRVRARAEQWIVTLFLVNGQTEPDQDRDEAWVFQPELLVEAGDGSAAFVRRTLPGRDLRFVDPQALAEERELAMLHRRELEFAVGHGVSVGWDPAPEDRARAARLRTIVAPSCDVPQVTSVTAEDEPLLVGLELGMEALGGLASGELAPKLEPLLRAYGDWVARQRRRAEANEDELEQHRDAAKGVLERCEKALERMREGVVLLTRDEQARLAFQFANRAMALSRARARIAQARRRNDTGDDATIAARARDAWRPFQLAFILLNLAALTDLHHPARSDALASAVDLLWFPTGGGKTEAYLGLAAYTLALRRLRGPVEGRSPEHGIAVLMRYTLRLLTIQQFQRAASLICACEMLRREAVSNADQRWGREPFRIGLWVGMRTTPNTTESALDAVVAKHKGKGAIQGGGHPLQITTCPWCGSALEEGRDVRVDKAPKGLGRTLVFCSDSLGRCPFTAAQAPDEGLPVITVDEEIYRRTPSLLIATVDKFALMPWKGETQMLFGRVDGLCPRHGFTSPEIEDAGSHPEANGRPAVRRQPHGLLRPPDLIIQDELHLISGPLGSLVGLYETALDDLCCWTVDGRQVRPKVLASTATIRRAGQQTHDLFLRQLEVFPPGGLDLGDSFFARVRPPSVETPGRRYLGICAPGKRVKAAYIRAYVSLMLAANTLYQRYDHHADPWMTLVGYFNTIRELGGMRRVVEDDIRARLARGDEFGFVKRKPPDLEELTSRTPSTRIPRVLDRLELQFSLADDAARQAARQSGGPVIPTPTDVLLATNMVSVGVDVQRLGLMVVAGQPKTTAEYIQATSRVGRRHPGLVCTVLNWARPRDMSHYERFAHYHATFYQSVEALSVTPFALRALDRGLSAVFVALVRIHEARLNANSAAQEFTPEDEATKRAVATILTRVEALKGSPERVEEVRQMLQCRVDEWHRRARHAGQGSKLGYEARKDRDTVGLLQRPAAGRWDLFTCLLSLRDVEPAVNLVLADFGLDDEVPAPPATEEVTS